MKVLRPVTAAILFVVLALLTAGALVWLRASQRQQSAPAVTAAETGLPESVTLSPESLRLAALSIETVHLQPLRRTLRLFGQIELSPESVADLNARVVGRIVQIRVRVGDQVRAGQVLAVLDSQDVRNAQADYMRAKRRMQFAFAELQRRRRMAELGAFDNPPLEEVRKGMAQAQEELRTAESEYRAAQQAVESEQSSVRKARVAWQLSQARLDRAQKLLGAQLIAQQEYDALRAENETAAAELQAAEARLISAREALLSAEARLQSAKEGFQIAQARLQRGERVFRGQYLSSKEVAEAESDYQQAKMELNAAEAELRLLGSRPGEGSLLQVVAPFDGKVVEVRAAVGETVTPDKPFLRIVNTSKVWAVFDLYPQDLPLVRVGQRVRFKTDALPDMTYEAVIDTIMPEADPNMRVVKARARISNDSGTLKPGQFIEGVLTVKASKDKLLLVPSEAVQKIEDGTYVFVATETPGEFRLRQVQIAEQEDNMSVIRDGLRPGERVVVHNASLLKGMLTGGGEE